MNEKPKNKSEHTPGPWMVNLTIVDNAVVRWHIASEKYGSVYPICEHVFEFEPSVSEQKANAQLIASAPELLDALDECTKTFLNMEEILSIGGCQSGVVLWNQIVEKSDMWGTFGKARKAITKAKGGES